MRTSPAPVRQIAVFVPDVRAAALKHSAEFGSGPFFVADNIPLAVARHRGVDRALDHSSAYGQWGTIMMEFVQQNNPGPSVFHDLYPEYSGRFGLHHVAVFVPDLALAIKIYEAQGYMVALYAEMADGFPFAMIDKVAECGTFLELYEPRPALTGFYDMVARKADGWDGHDPIRTISFG